MYVVLNRFLLSCQSLDLRRVPEFFKLFYGFDLEVNYSVFINHLYLMMDKKLDISGINKGLNKLFLHQQHVTFICLLIQLNLFQWDVIFFWERVRGDVGVDLPFFSPLAQSGA